MIDPKAIVSYSQYNEDIILKALFYDVKKGFYIDVGANYPTIDSVTKLFYDSGWNGINIEPIKSLHALIQKERPRDTNLQCGLGQKPGEATLREYTELSGHSTFDTKQKQQHKKSQKYSDYSVSIKTLNQLFEEYKPQQVNFIKIDVEGFEYEVIAGNEWSKNRPQAVCIEANHVTHDWRTILDKNDYLFFIADGLNEYYIAKECWNITDGFAERAIKLDYHALKQHQWQSWSKDSENLEQASKQLTEQSLHIQKLETRLHQTERLSLYNRTFLGRLKRAMYGLTVDWIRYKRSKS